MAAPAGCKRRKVEDTWTDPGHLPVNGRDPTICDENVRGIELAVDERHREASQQLDYAFVAGKDGHQRRVAPPGSIRPDAEVVGVVT